MSQEQQYSDEHYTEEHKQEYLENYEREHPEVIQDPDKARYVAEVAKQQEEAVVAHANSARSALISAGGATDAVDSRSLMALSESERIKSVGSRKAANELISQAEQIYDDTEFVKTGIDPIKRD